MKDFGELLEEIKRRSGLSEGEVLRLIEEKKAKIGGGYLTDAGAAYLVASDLGIRLGESGPMVLKLKDLYVGANDVLVLARIMSMGSEKTYGRRGGGEGAYRQMVVFDGSGVVRVMLWDERAKDVEGLKPNDPVRIRARVRSGRDGSPILSVGARGSIEVLDESEASSLPTIDGLTKELEEVKEGRHLIVKGYVESGPVLRVFEKRDGSEGRMLQLQLSGKSGIRVRAVIWDWKGDAPEIPQGSLIRLIDVKAKLLSYGELELHGGEATSIEVLEKGSGGGARMRIVSMGRVRTLPSGLKSLSALAIDERGNPYVIVARGDAVEKLKRIGLGSAVVCMPDSVMSNALLCNTEASIRRGEEGGLPTLESMKRKVAELEEGKPASLEVMVLTQPSIREITTRSGVVVRKGEVLVGDDSDEVRLVAWRELVEELEGLKPGDRVSIRGVVPKLDPSGTLYCQLKSYTGLERI